MSKLSVWFVLCAVVALSSPIAASDLRTEGLRAMGVLDPYGHPKAMGVLDPYGVR